ncbi:response regulator [Oscillochloris sp. ZM17-4]|uniref:response regulator n=1 Tax=Oscillochloris sp. ZM17-4 TaxID=2866714 RepID=UPI001C73A1D8|nr:response regulator [Oscillochloris sp. ZM17-4]MBX0326360.1 response regulator [Oscillochloris sp. ZM17-4]
MYARQIVSAPLHRRDASNPRRDILVVDDHAEITAMLSEILTEEGYHIRVARNGVEALREVQIRRPDLILMDVAMPHMRGDQVILRLRDQAHGDIPVILMTADQQPERFRGLGARQVIRKPFDLSYLLDAVAQNL